MDSQMTRRPFPEEVLEQVLSFVSAHTDRNSVSLVCKSWYDIERWSRRHVYIANCYAVNPETMIRRFTDVRSITIKGKHCLPDSEFLPEGWGAHALPWIAALAAAYPAIEEIRMKTMVVTDEGLKLIAMKLHNLRVLVLHRCEGFYVEGLASIAANCSNLRMLDLYESYVRHTAGDWISFFPESFTSLEFLALYNPYFGLPFSSLERLVDRCPNLKTLCLESISFPLEKVVSLLLKAPQLVDLGINLLTTEPCPEAFRKLARAFEGCKGIKSVHGLFNCNPYYLPAIFPACSGITYLNLCAYNCSDLTKLLRHCPNLQRLWVGKWIGDDGLEQVSASCKELQELKVGYYNRDLESYGDQDFNITECGLVSVVVGCPKLHSIQYFFCSQMTNAALVTIAKHMPNLTRLEIGMHCPKRCPDYLTQQPFDNGFSAILERCKNLTHLLIDCFFTDRLLEQIGTHGKKLEFLLLANGGNSDVGLHHVLSGCNNLQKLTLRGSSYGGPALLANSEMLERIQSLLMDSCKVRYQECKLLGVKHPSLNVEIMHQNEPLRCIMQDDRLVKDLYVYRTVAGPRLDMPHFVCNTSKKMSLGQVYLESMTS